MRGSLFFGFYEEVEAEEGGAGSEEPCWPDGFSDGEQFALVALTNVALQEVSVTQLDADIDVTEACFLEHAAGFFFCVGFGAWAF